MFGIELAVARETGRSRFYFSPHTHLRMLERRNTHFCFHCGGEVGFTPGPNGEATNSTVGNGKGAYNPMARHDPATHANGVIAGAELYSCARDWLRNAEYPTGFPYVIKIQ